MDWFKPIRPIDPDHLNAHYNLGVAYSKKGLFHKAINEYREVLRLNPDDIQAQEGIMNLIAKGREQ